MSLSINKTVSSASPSTNTAPLIGQVEVLGWRVKVVNLIKATRLICSESDIEEFEKLVRENQDKINQRIFYSDSTVFHELAKRKHPERFVGILAHYGIDFSIQDSWLGDTPLMWAVANGKNEMAREILLHLPVSQADSLNKQCKAGNSVLHLIIGKGYTTKDLDKIPLAYSNFQLLQLAIEKGAHVNLADRDGNTPLHVAYARRDYNMIKLLIESGAEQNYLNYAGKTPREMIQLGKDEEDNYAKAQSVLFYTTSGCYILKENNYKDLNNLEAILSL